MKLLGPLNSSLVTAFFPPSPRRAAVRERSSPKDRAFVPWRTMLTPPKTEGYPGIERMFRWGSEMVKTKGAPLLCYQGTGRRISFEELAYPFLQEVSLW